MKTRSSQRSPSSRSSRPSRCRPLHVETLESRDLLAATLMTGYEQLFLELVNRARANPVAESERLGIPLNRGLPANTISTAAKQPLAPHPALLEAARAHSKDMLDRGFFDHVNPDGQSPGDRARARGYTGSVGENIVGISYPTAYDPDYASDVEYFHELLFDSPGHRQNLMSANYNEAGFGLEFRVSGAFPWTYVDATGTENFGRNTARKYITGVVFDDLVNGNAFYDVGEGVSDVIVRARAANGQTYQETAGASGGYAIAVPNGSFTVVLIRDGVEISPRRTVNVGSQNVKVDFIANPRDARLTLTIDKDRFAEDVGANSARLRIERSGVPTTAPMTVTVTSSTPGGLKRIDHATDVTIPANQTFVEIAIHALDNDWLDGDVRVDLVASSGTLVSPSLPVTVLDRERLTVEASPTEFLETAGGGATVLVITRSNTNLSLPVTVNLRSSDPNALRVPESVTIAAGQKSVQVGLTAVDDRLSPLDKNVEVIAESTGYASASKAFRVKNVQALSTALQAQALVLSDPVLRATTGFVALRNPAPAGGHSFSVHTVPAGLLDVPETVQIPEGQTQVSVPVSLLANGVPNGRSIVKITVSGNGMASEATLVVLSSMNATWTNQSQALDVDNNGFTDPLDVLTLINAINGHGTRRLDNQREVDRVLGYVDVNGDGFLDPLDVLEIVNHINRR